MIDFWQFKTGSSQKICFQALCLLVLLNISHKNQWVLVPETTCKALKFERIYMDQSALRNAQDLLEFWRKMASSELFESKNMILLSWEWNINVFKADTHNKTNTYHLEICSWVAKKCYVTRRPKWNKLSLPNVPAKVRLLWPYEAKKTVHSYWERYELTTWNSW